MKNVYLKLLLASVILFLGRTALAQSINITYPINGGVLQRNSSNAANVSFCGTVGYGFDNSTLYDYRLVVTPLNLFSGESTGATGFTWPFTLLKIPGTEGSIFNIYLNIPAGWYEVDILVTPKSSSTPPIGGLVQKVFKFGVGDVFVIAGQSNAQGFQDDFDIGLINSYSGITDADVPDAARVIGQAERDYIKDYEPGNSLHDFSEILDRSSLPLIKGFEKLTLSKPLLSKNTLIPDNPNTIIFDRPIFPYGVASWCWAPLAKKYVTAHQVPVAFYNVANSNTSINQWQKGQDNYNRLLDIIINQANMTGFRGVLWHQGERDAQDGMSQSDYQTKLQNLVNNIQNDYDPLGTNWGVINWYISRASLYGGTSSGDLTNNNIINAQNSSAFTYSVKKDGIASDVIGSSQRGPHLKIHFHDASLNTAADLWNTKLSSLSANVKHPMQAIGRLTYADLGSSLRLARFDDFPIDEIKWVKNEDGIISPVGTGNYIDVPKFSSNKEIYTAYVKPQGQKYYLITTPFVVANSVDKFPSILINGENYTINSTSSAQLKKLAFLVKNMVSWTATIPSGVSWVSILGSSSGSSGNHELSLQLAANNGINLRSTQVSITGIDVYNQTVTRTISVSQTGSVSSNGGQASLSLTSLTPVSGSTPFGTIHYNGLNVVGNDMYIGGIKYTQGIGTHAQSNIVYNIPSGYNYFTGKVGRDDGSDNCECGPMTCDFQIKLNGVLKWSSQVHNINTMAESFSVNLAGAGGTLELILNERSDGGWGDWGDWVNVYLSGSSTLPENIPAPINYTVSPASGSPGSSRTLSANCSTGTVTWSTGQTGSAVNVNPSASTTYTVKCVSGSQQSDPRTVTATVSSGSSACAPVADNTVMGVWTVTNHQLVSRLFHSQYWLVQKVNVNGGLYDEFVVRASEMLQRGDVNLSNSSYNGLVNCYALKYSGYGGLLGPNHTSTIPFATPSGYTLYYATDGTPYYSTFGSTGSSSSSPITNNGCYTIKSLANNYFLEATANDFNEFKVANNANNQKWKFTSSDNVNWKIKAADGSNKYLYAEGTYCGARIKRTNNASQSNQLWKFDQNGGAFRFFLPDGTTWDHEGASTLSNLQTCGDNTQGFQTWRLVQLTSVGCPSGVRMGNLENQETDKEMPFLNILPNPSSGVFEVSVYLENQGTVSLELIDVLGRKLIEHTFVGQKGENKQTIDAKSVGQGTFFLQATHAEKRESKRVSIQ